MIVRNCALLNAITIWFLDISNKKRKSTKRLSLVTYYLHLRPRNLKVQCAKTFICNE